jgi:mannose-6-phosphate isomerase-like protein (cupin superfamily)
MSTEVKTMEPHKTYIQLKPTGETAPHQAGEFWKAVAGGHISFQNFGYMFSSYKYPSGHATNWEMHPKGDEVLYLVTGKVTVVMRSQSEENATELTERQALIVPRGTWHRFVTNAPTELIGVTWGEGTEHRELKN